MVTPAFLSAASDEVMKLYADLEDAIKTDMARRLARLGRISTSTDWQAKILKEAGSLGGDIDKYLRSYDKKTQKTVKQLFKQLTAKATGELAPNQAQMIAATQGYTGLVTDLHNLTRTSTAVNDFVIAANNLYMQTASGAFSFTEALKSTVASPPRGSTRYPMARDPTILKAWPGPASSPPLARPPANRAWPAPRKPEPTS